MQFSAPKRNATDIEIGRRLAAELERQGLSADQVLVKAGISGGDLSLQIAGLARFGASGLILTLRLLGKTPAWLFDRLFSDEGSAS